MIVCLVLTVLCGTLAGLKLTLNASFEKMIPRSHPYIQNYLDNRPTCADSATRCASSSRTRRATSTIRAYLDTLRKINDETRSDTRRRPRLGQVAVDARGALDRSHRRRLPRRPGHARQLRRLAAATEQLRGNIARSGIVGSLVGNDFSSSMLVVPLLDQDPTTGSVWTTASCRTISKRFAPARGRPEVDGERARDRLRQARRRPDRRPDPGRAVLPAWPR
jgi:uncharacterized membrane protein YccC